jgi:hypothetical protein
MPELAAFCYRAREKSGLGRKPCESSSFSATVVSPTISISAWRKFAGPCPRPMMPRNLEVFMLRRNGYSVRCKSDPTEHTEDPQHDDSRWQTGTPDAGVALATTVTAHAGRASNPMGCCLSAVVFRYLFPRRVVATIKSKDVPFRMR